MMGIKGKMMAEMMEKMRRHMMYGGCEEMMDKMKEHCHEGDCGEHLHPHHMWQHIMECMCHGDDTSAYGTPELQSLFQEWLAQIEEECLSFVKENPEADIKVISDHFKLSQESILFILNKLAEEGRINLKPEWKAGE